MKDEMTNVSLDEIPDEAVEKSTDSASEHHHRHHRRHHHSHRSNVHSHKHKHHRHKKSSSALSEKRKLKFKDFIHDNKKRLINIAIALVFVIALIVVASVRDLIGFSNVNNDSNVENNTPIQGDTVSSLQIEIPVFTGEVNLVNQAVLDYLDAENSLTASELYEKYSPDGRLDTGVPVRLYYNILGLPSGYAVSSSRLYVSENEDLASPRIYDLNSSKRSVDVYNLKANSQYYYSFDIKLTDNNSYTVNGSFKTADTPRMINIDGVFNARDIGGVKTSDGRGIKQGLLYRGTELDGAVVSSYKITSDGLTEMLTVLGIKTDMDLRAATDSNGFDALGSNVEHVCYNSAAYKDIFTDSGSKAVKNVFSDLAKKENYPVYLHCTYGTDRTGTICYLLEALLGADESQCMRDYELSVFHRGEVLNDSMEEFVLNLKSYGGANLKSNAENYLLSIGVTPDEITSIREIFLSENQ